MNKVLCIIGIVVAVLLLLVFGVDASVGDRIGFPFNGASLGMDISMIVCALVLGYISWATLRQQV